LYPDLAAVIDRWLDSTCLPAYFGAWQIYSGVVDSRRSGDN
jgi:hypothetical protein